MQVISSPQNPRVKELVRLSAEKRQRYLSGLFVVESVKLAQEAVLAGISVQELYFTEKAAEKYPQELKLIGQYAKKQYSISQQVAEKLSSFSTTQGVFCVCTLPEPKLKADHLNAKGRYLLLSSLQDPGNLGAVIRSALAFGCDGLVLSADCPDLYSPKVLRSAMGGVFRLPVLTVPDLREVVVLLRQRGVEVFAAALDRSAVTPEQAILGRDGIAAVSYTHLDVYKRQGYSRLYFY